MFTRLPVAAPARRATALVAAVAVLLTLLVQLAVSGNADARSATRYTVPAVPQRSSVEKNIGNAVLAEINRERAQNGLRPVAMNSDLQLSARRHNVMMAQQNTMSHQVRNEPVFTTRFTDAGYTWHWAGENIAWNSDMSQSGMLAVQRMMYNEKPPNDGHRVNILNTQFRDVGVDVLFDNTHHKAWLTTDFGRH